MTVGGGGKGVGVGMIGRGVDEGEGICGGERKGVREYEWAAGARAQVE